MLPSSSEERAPHAGAGASSIPHGPILIRAAPGHAGMEAGGRRTHHQGHHHRWALGNLVPLTQQRAVGMGPIPPFPPSSALHCCLAPHLCAPTDYRLQSSPGAMPELPAYVLFLCIRHADHCRDEPRAHSLLDAAINAIKRVMKVLGAGKLLGG